MAIREGREVGADGVTALHEVGCAARAAGAARRHPDGTYDVVDRRRGACSTSTGLSARPRDYLVGEVTLAAGRRRRPRPRPRCSAPSVRRGLREPTSQRQANAGAGEAQPARGLPDDPLVLSHLVAATALLDLDERQALLAAP